MIISTGGVCSIVGIMIRSQFAWLLFISKSVVPPAGGVTGTLCGAQDGDHHVYAMANGEQKDGAQFQDDEMVHGPCAHLGHDKKVY
jgi:hypothetical protein